ncbi:type I-C CRISPR-associated endonuclease Cas1 [Gluconacetobacter diazotrophicus]|uniref:CRISPR-associated endonuclease Cas1 n=1 Tax=Gluconacetobacter diazotrophicus TaxID=33996 RepID=A0A7W4I6S6_GLUDI|nr:type I-C CRISPR-associated endonuclease Cas1c [Gluconacetobacter diazotrophicus]MBB2157279.1 type I-C CRISPR-associated endonuclease Cas1 [Gluconacetobacter diazotrophicus]
MRRHLNTIYVTTEDAWLRKDGANVVVEVEGQERGRAPMHLLDGIMCFGRIGASPALMGACAESGLALSWLSPQGRFLARVEGPRSGNVLLRRTQYRTADSTERALPIVRNMVAAKAANQRTVIRRALRDHGPGLNAQERTRLDEAERRLTIIVRRITQAPDVDTARGMEGEAAQVYFGIFNLLIRVEGDAFTFGGRSRRPPLDRVNALLSFLYAVLGHDCRSALESVGLDPQVGFLHADRPGRNSLALDMMEELRPVLADRLAVSLINRRQVAAGDFTVSDGGAVLLNDDARKTVLVAWQDRKKKELRHPFLNESLTFGLVAHVQALLLSRHLRGELDGYPAFVWK